MSDAGDHRSIEHRPDCRTEGYEAIPAVDGAEAVSAVESGAVAVMYVIDPDR